jgi:hypothetical protein
MEQVEDCTMSELPFPDITATPISFAKSESWGILQKALFLAVIVGCVVVYLYMSRAKKEDVQGYEKSLA